jgi:hypothetical protein
LSFALLLPYEYLQDSNCPEPSLVFIGNFISISIGAVYRDVDKEFPSFAFRVTSATIVGFVGAALLTVKGYVCPVRNTAKVILCSYSYRMSKPTGIIVIFSLSTVFIINVISIGVAAVGVNLDKENLPLLKVRVTLAFATGFVGAVLITSTLCFEMNVLPSSSTTVALKI